jgi:hypothetical protein
MEDMKKKFEGDYRDQEIVYSKAIKAGKRIYYLDVKKNRKNELFLAITESKKKINGEDLVSFEKHKIFLYREDFEKFKEGFEEVINFINKSTENEIDKDEEEDLVLSREKNEINKFEIEF